MNRILIRGRGGSGRKRPRKWLPTDWETWVVNVGCADVHLFGRRGFGISAWSLHRVDGVRLLWCDCVHYGDVVVKKRKPREVGAEVPPHLAAVESDLFCKLLPLVAHCADTRYDDGSARTPGWWTLKTMGSAWVVEVKDPDTCSRLVVVQQSVDDALTLASVLLESEEAPWERDPWMVAQQAKKKK